MSTSFAPLAAARAAYALGANITCIRAGSKQPAHAWKPWSTQRQTETILDRLPWSRAQTLGIISGINDWRCFDLDAAHVGGVKQPIPDWAAQLVLDALGLPHDYVWHGRSSSGAGWHVWIRCAGELPDTLRSAAQSSEAGVIDGVPHPDYISVLDHLELRWERCQTVLPAPHGYTAATFDSAPARVSVEQVLAAFLALATPKQPASTPAMQNNTLSPAPASDPHRAAMQPHTTTIPADRRVVSNYLARVVVDELHKVATAPDGHKHYTLRDAAIKLGSLLHYGLDEDAMTQQLYTTIAPRAADPQRAAHTIHDGLAHGKANPRMIADRPNATNGSANTNGHTTPSAPPPAAPAPRFVVRTLADLDTIDTPAWAIDGEVIEQGYHLIYGASGGGKTFYAVDRALRLAAAGKRVQYIATENLAGLKIRVRAWQRAHPSTALHTFTWLDMAHGLDLLDAQQVADFLTTLAPYQYDHIVIDTLREAHTGEENSSQDGAAINRAIQSLIKMGASVDVVHHSGVEDKRPRGTTAIFANADMVLRVGCDGEYVSIHTDKVRNSSPPSDRRYALISTDTGLTDKQGASIVSAVLQASAHAMQRSAALGRMHRSILDALALSVFSETGAKTRDIIATADGVNERTIYRVLSELKDRGYISQGTKGDPYYITPAGRAQLGPEVIAANVGCGTATDMAHTAAVSPTDSTDTPLTRTVIAVTDNPSALTDTDRGYSPVSAVSAVSEDSAATHTTTQAAMPEIREATYTKPEQDVIAGVRNALAAQQFSEARRYITQAQKSGRLRNHRLIQQLDRDIDTAEQLTQSIAAEPATEAAAAAHVAVLHIASRVQALITGQVYEQAWREVAQIPNDAPIKAELLAQLEAVRSATP